ncbi:ABC transporter ATP-binding protein/permease [Spongiibacter taiwanensis]|uniref:ATP-binding cassette domain-containing protein n=1 Tax=Spongiibacter taiwanensis TaxID=1748242 RepID=UPI002034C82A|nr:ABC transporter ATP-binding protein [Spongiibacter taiwanensis]USA44260.1 ABC transporter ATP-binding protein/permease [Spongiibacter taiwanensis]
MYLSIKSVFALLSTKQQREYWLVTVLLSITAIAAVIPAITTLIDFQSAVEKGYLHTLYQWLGKPDKPLFLALVTAGAIGFIWGGALLTTLGVFARQRFTRRISADISARAFNYYMAQPIEPFYARPGSEFLRNVNGISERIATGIIDASFVILSRAVQLAVIAAVLMVFNVRVTLFILLIIAGAYFLIYSLIKRNLRRMSAENFDSQKQLNQMISGSYADYRNIHIDGRLKDYLQHFRLIKKRTSKKTANIEILGTIPRNFIEVLGMTLLLVAAYYLGKTAESAHQLVTTISLFAIAAYKILPAAQQIYHAVSKVTGAAVVFDRVKAEWKTLPLSPSAQSNPLAKVSDYKRLSLNSVYYAHQGKAWVIQELNADVELRGVVRITGPSGAGKTTLIELLAGLRQPTSGTISLDQTDLQHIPQAQWWASIAYVNQNGYLFAGTLRANIVGSDKQGDESLYQRISDICGLHTLPSDVVNEGATNLSGGQKCRVLIARALYKKAQLLFLDESLSPLDVDAAKTILRGIQQTYPDCCIFVISHRSEELEPGYQEVVLSTSVSDMPLTLDTGAGKP